MQRSARRAAASFLSEARAGRKERARNIAESRRAGGAMTRAARRSGRPAQLSAPQTDKR